jgi:dihydroorotate dehydrogenase (NAD+) catalytic subunit
MGIEKKSEVLKQKNGLKQANLSVQIAGLKLKNPVMTASGTYGYGEEYAEFYDLNRLGALVVKGLSAEPRQGNPPPRLVETPAGMLNAIGLQNIGIKAFISDKMPFLRQFDTPVIVNFFGDNIGEFERAAEELSDTPGISALEMNISCPNKQAGWAVFGTDPGIMDEVITKTRKKTTLPLIVKLSPNVTSIAEMAKIAENAGADAVSLINTLTGMVIDVKSRKPVLANRIGGLSGPAIRPVAVRMVWQVCRAVSIPVIGLGGIMNANDALEFMIAGARAIQVGTANFVNPLAAADIIDGIGEFLAGEGISDINEIIGSLKA